MNDLGAWSGPAAPFYLAWIPQAAVQAQFHFIFKKRWIAAVHYLSCNCISKGNLTMTSPLCSQSCLLIHLHYLNAKVPGLLYYEHFFFFFLASRRCQRSSESFELEVTTQWRGVVTRVHHCSPLQECFFTCQHTGNSNMFKLTSS